MSAPLDTALDFSGRAVLITGGTKGVGRGIAARFLEAGADVVVTARNEPETAIEHDGRAARFQPCDIRDVDQLDALVSFAASGSGRLDVLVNNAGGSPSADAATASPRFAEAIIRLNLI